MKAKENAQETASPRGPSIPTMHETLPKPKKEVDTMWSALFASLDPANVGSISKYTFIERLNRMGIQSDDPRIAPLVNVLMKSPNDYLEIRLDEFIELTKNHSVLIQRALQGQLIIPRFSDFCKKLTAIFNTVKEDKRGEVASYIPQLAKVSPDKYGMSVCSIDGQVFSLGDSRDYFSLQSISKTVSYCLALEEFGEDVVHNHVGREPSGTSFNAITLDSQNRPHNPMINAGSIMACSMIMPDAKPAERFDYVLSVWERLAGMVRPIFNNTVFLSEKQHADRNYALAYFMNDKKKFPKNTNLTETLDLYFQCCSIELNTERLAVVAATLAKGGVNPLTGERVLAVDTVKNCLSLMNSCGMYDFSGEFAFTIGIPAKSGVGGGLMMVVPNVMGICVWSPPLDQNGNTVKGVDFSRELVRHFNFHNYDSLVSGDSEKTDPRKRPIDIKMNGVVALCWAAAQGDVNEMQQILATGSNLNESDYDGRTPLHLAASEGHLKAVEFLVKHGATTDVKDRWGNTPLDDASRGGHTDIVSFLRTSIAPPASSSSLQDKRALET